MYCDHCGASIDAGSKFCGECGNSLPEGLVAHRSARSYAQRRGSRKPPKKFPAFLIVSIPAVFILLIVVWFFSGIFGTRREAFEKVLPENTAPRADPLGNGEARTVIETAWNKAGVELMLGEVKFVAENLDQGKGREGIEMWPLYQAFAKSGVIAISNEKDLTKNFGGWNDWFSLTQSGVRRTATIRLGERGKAGGTVKRIGDFDLLLMKVATTKVESIVANDEVLVGTDQYRVVLGTFTSDVRAEMSAAFERYRDRNKFLREGRFKILLKYDPFDKQWRMVTQDFGKRTEDFRSNTVGRTIQSLKLGNR